MRDDTIHENDDVKEAIRRLPENLYNDRVFRIKRALDLTMRQQILPKEQWTKYEEMDTLRLKGEVTVPKSLSKSLEE
uniref:Cytochrome b-c1 complex subunit 7 n=1 Tax=Equus caballus TaxID=9796 RepID=F6Z0Q3_HORSE